MASKYWLKLFHETLDDSKVMTLTPALRWRFIECLLVAGEKEENGYLPSTEAYAWRVRCDLKTADQELHELAEAGLISQLDGRWFVNKFVERQTAATGADRWRRWRDRKKTAEYEVVLTNHKRSTNDVPNETLVGANDMPNETLAPEVETSTNETLDRSDKDKEEKRKDQDLPFLKNSNGNYSQYESEQLAKMLAEQWGYLTNQGVPLNPVEATLHYYRPAEIILKANDWDFDQAFEVLKAARAHSPLVFRISDLVELNLQVKT